MGRPVPNPPRQYGSSWHGCAEDRFRAGSPAILIVSASEAVQHPATEARSRSAAVTLDVWTGESGMHPGTQLLKPMAQQLLKSRPDHFTCSQQQPLIPVGESEDALQIFEIVPGHG